MRLHIGCGTIYLRGYVNIDLPGPRTFLASERPDLVERWVTEDAEYYSRHKDKSISSLREGPLDQEAVCDRYGSLFFIPAVPKSAMKVLLVHVFEHLSMTESWTALTNLNAVLMMNGILDVDVPDHEETLNRWRETGDAFFKRHLLGPRRNEFGYHVMGYTRERLRTLIESRGFVFVRDLPNIHLYPSIAMRFRKAEI